LVDKAAIWLAIAPQVAVWVIEVEQAVWVIEVEQLAQAIERQERVGAERIV
jgi:hypothetical protein